MDIPSLFMIPSAVSSGKVHSVFPNSTDADFDFNRDSDATRVNSEGLIERVGYYGSELVTNGNFATNTNWSFVGDGSISNGQLILPCCISNNRVSQSIGMSSSKSYKLEINITEITSGDTIDFLQGGAWNSFGTKLGINTVIISNPSDADLFLRNDNGTSRIKIDNVSVKEVLGDRARLNYEIEGGLVNTKPSLLLEPQSTNLITYSQDISQLTNSNLTINSNSVISPDGTMNAARVIPTTNSAQHRFTPNTTVSTSTVYTASIFAKADGYNRIRLAENATTGGDARFDLQNGTILTTNGVTAKIEAFPNDWFRCSITETTASTSFRFDVIVMDDSSNSTFAGDGYSGVQLWGYQLEQLSYPTSYIPTNGSTQTRSGETCNGAGTSSILPSEEGILYGEFAVLANDATDKKIAIGNGTNQNVVVLQYTTISNQIRAFVSNGSLQFNAFEPITDATQFNKIGIRWKANDFALWVNGTQTDTDTSGTTFSAGTLSEFAFDDGGGNADFYGKIRDIRVYNTKEMTDSEVDILLNKITS